MTEKEKLEKLKKLADAMYYAAQYLTTDASSLRKTMENYRQFIINEYHKEKPVSEDLEEEIERHLKECLDVKFPTTNIELIKKDVRYTAKHFVNWQMQQFMKNVVLETEVLRDSDGDGVETPYESWLTLANTEIPELPESLGLREGDKVKIVIVKSE